MPERLVAEAIRLNYQDFRALPDDGKRYEILDGDLYMSPSPRTVHQRVVLRLGRILADHVERTNLGEVLLAPLDVVLSDNDIVEPDLIFISRTGHSIVTETNVQGVPDLLVEVLSASRPELDTRDKRNLYQRCGVPYYWLVDGENGRLTELQLAGEAYVVVADRAGNEIFRPRLFPGLTIHLDHVWAPGNPRL